MVSNQKLYIPCDLTTVISQVIDNNNSDNNNNYDNEFDNDNDNDDPIRRNPRSVLDFRYWWLVIESRLLSWISVMDISH